MSLLKDNIRSMIANHEQHRLGKVLTIIDASISDPEQRKGLKDLVKEAFWAEVYFSQHLPNLIEQFVNRLGIYDIYQSSKQERDFKLGSLRVSDEDRLNPSYIEDFFPELHIQEDPGVTSGEANSPSSKN